MPPTAPTAPSSLRASKDAPPRPSRPSYVPPYVPIFEARFQPRAPLLDRLGLFAPQVLQATAVFLRAARTPAVGPVVAAAPFAGPVEERLLRIGFLGGPLEYPDRRHAHRLELARLPYLHHRKDGKVLREELGHAVVHPYMTAAPPDPLAGPVPALVPLLHRRASPYRRSSAALEGDGRPAALAAGFAGGRRARISSRCSHPPRRAAKARFSRSGKKYNPLRGVRGAFRSCWEEEVLRSSKNPGSALINLPDREG